MPTPPLSEDLMREALDAFERCGNVTDAAASLNINRSTYLNRLTRARASFGYEDPAIEAAKQAIGTNMRPALAWAKTKNEDGTSYSVLLKPVQIADDTISRIRAAFEDLTPAEPVEPPQHVEQDMCNVFPLFDVHWGMRAWGDETGGDDYDLKSAESDLIRATESVLRIMPQAEEAVLIIGGDFYHADDNTAQTPAHRHNLDVDGRMHKVLDTSIRTVAYLITRLLERHRSVYIRVLRGNHDEHSHLVLSFALAERYRNEERVTVDKSPVDLLMRQWGQTSIFAHHGDKSNATEFVLKLADVCPFWSETPHRYAYTGHRHKMGGERIGGLYWERLEAFCPADQYGATWANRRALKADSYHKRTGRVLTAFDPIMRPV